jgi:hypothetical protein
MTGENVLLGRHGGVGLPMKQALGGASMRSRIDKGQKAGTDMATTHTNIYQNNTTDVDIDMDQHNWCRQCLREISLLAKATYISCFQREFYANCDTFKANVRLCR